MALYVHDLEEARQFFVEFFEASANDMYYNPRTGLKSYFLIFDDGAKLEIMQRPDMTASDFDIMRQGYNHIAFGVGSKERVDSLTRKLDDSGYEVLSGPRTTGDGYYESCIRGIENNIIEITE